MTQNKIQVIRSDRGSCLTTLAVFLLVLVVPMIWIAISDYVIDRTPIVRQELFQNEWLMACSFLFGVIFHEFCQYALIRLFGGIPRFSGRTYDPGRTYFQWKYLSTVIMRFWSPGKTFTLAQYLLVVLSPTIITFGLFPAAMLVWQAHSFHSAIWIIGFTNSALIALDISIAFRLVASGHPNYYVVDESEGTYLVKRQTRERQNAG